MVVLITNFFIFVPSAPFSYVQSHMFRSLTLTDVLRDHRSKFLPIGDDDREHLTVRRNHILQGTLHALHAGITLKKHLKVTLVGEPAVDAGGPLREFFHHIMCEVAENNSLFCGLTTARSPRHNVMELEKKTFYFVGVIIALSLVHGGPEPQFFCIAVADYIMKGVKALTLLLKMFLIV